MPKKIFVESPPLTKIEQKYCACLLNVRNKSHNKYNPYSICTNSVYGSRGLTRNKQVGCEYNYDYSKLSTNSLKNLGAEKHMKGTRAVLIKKLSKKAQKQRIKKYKTLKAELNSLRQKK
jgi:hypothetical protein